MRRAVDYLKTRGDVDAGAIGYYGVSWGAERGSWALAIEDRIKAAALADGGIWLDRLNRPDVPAADGGAWTGPLQGPEQNPIHFLPRIKIPVLMLNGEFDPIFPLKEAQEPMFHLLGTPAEHKRHRLSKVGHMGTTPHERIQETLDWFDRYLGPVTAK